MNSYNPLDKKNLAESIVNELLRSPATKLGQLQSFSGAGVYIIYYAGDFPMYQDIRSDADAGAFDTPIYVGKAVPKGGRIGGFGLDAEPGYVLYGRLIEHFESVTQAENLNQDDFYCRYIVLEDIWIPLAESLMITRHSPVWNVVMAGFGNHDPGSGRAGSRKPLWDEVHPGRPWAAKLAPALLSTEQIGENVKKHLELPPEQVES